MREGQPGETASGADLIVRVRTTADPEDAVDLIYTEIDALLRKSSFGRVDQLLRDVEVSTLPLVPLLAFVSITNAARNVLSARPEFMTRVRGHLAKVEPGRIEELLAGLE